MQRDEGRKFVKVSFKAEKKRTDGWTLRTMKKRPDEWIEGEQKTGETNGRKRNKMEKISKKSKKSSKKGLQFPGK